MVIVSNGEKVMLDKIALPLVNVQQPTVIARPGFVQEDINQNHLLLMSVLGKN